MSMIWLEVVLGFAVPVGWGLWELYALRRDREAAARRAADARSDMRSDVRSDTGNGGSG